MENILRTTLIIKLIERTETKNRSFIINRSCGIDNILHMSKRLVTWYEFESPGALRWFKATNYEILEELPYDNYKHRDQAIINEYKRKYIEQTEINDENEILCNQLFIDYTKNTNAFLKDTYYNLYGKYVAMTKDEIYEAVKTLWFSSARKYVHYKRYRLVAAINDMPEDSPYYNAMLAAIFLKKYLKERDSRHYYLPFQTKDITNTIANSYIENCISKKQLTGILENKKIINKLNKFNKYEYFRKSN